MPKLVLNNVPGHYEGSGFEVDINSQQIIIRTKRGESDDEPRIPKKQHETTDPRIGPNSTRQAKQKLRITTLLSRQSL